MNRPPEQEFDDCAMRRLEQAGDWLLRMGNDALTEGDVEEWLRWCDADPHNLRVFNQLQADWNTLDLLAPKATTGSAPQPAEAPPRGVVPRRGRMVRRRLPLKGAGLAAALVLAVSLAWLYGGGRVHPRDEVATAHANEQATLPDGSSVTLSAQTSLGVDFSGPLRQLSLSRGEAYFKVYHDTVHPFIVQAGPVRVTAVGTAFDVRRVEQRVVVTVEEGVVEVSAPDLRGVPAVWRAGPGYQVAYAADQGTTTVASIDAAAVLKWREGQLAYVWEPLGTVVEDVNRYSTRRIVLRDPRLAQLHFTGTVFTASIDDWLRAIQSAYPIRAVDGADGALVLEADGPVKDQADPS